MRILILLLLLVSFGENGFSQYKYEKELRIKAKDVPEKARNFVDSMPFSSKVKWYKEIGFDNTSIEAKTKHKGKRYSIEFSMDGMFEDAEIEIDPLEIAADSYSGITKHLQNVFKSYSLEKVQIQYSGNSNRVLAFLKNNETVEDISVNYEIVISAKVDGTYKMFEFLFSEKGGFIQKSEIKLQRADNINY